MLWYSVGMSVDPWIVAWPRSARIPPPGLPMLPSSSCSSAQQEIICGPYVCCVHPSAYANELVLSGPEFWSSVSATSMNFSFGQPVIS